MGSVPSIALTPTFIIETNAIAIPNKESNRLLEYLLLLRISKIKKISSKDGIKKYPNLVYN